MVNFCRAWHFRGPMSNTFSWLAAAVLLACILVALGEFGQHDGARSAGGDSPAPSPLSREAGSAMEASAGPLISKGGLKTRDGKIERDQKVLNEIQTDGTYENNLMKRFLKPLDADLLHELAKDPMEDESEFMGLVLQAAASHDTRFLYLLDNERLVKNPASQWHLAICAYDHVMTGNKDALLHLLDRYAKMAEKEGGRPGDSNELMVLGVVDEWDLTRKMFLGHDFSWDLSVRSALYAFWLTRRYLYPQNKDFPDDYQAFEREMLNERERC